MPELPATIDYASHLRTPKVKRTRVTNYRTGVYWVFLYNPDRITEKKGSNLVIDPIPGYGDPKVTWASGKPNIIDFSVILCGESRLRRSGTQLFNGAKGVAEFPLDQHDDTYSIAGEIEFFEQFQYPIEEGLGTAGDTRGEPDLLVFTHGRRYQSVLCAVGDVNIDIFEFDPDGNPTRAKIDMQLVRKLEKSRWAHEVWDIPSALPAATQRGVR